MPYASSRKLFGKGGGRFVVSEGVAPAEALRPHPELPTLTLDPVDNRFEIVITRGTILSVVQDSTGNSVVVPANGTSAAQTIDDSATPGAVTVPAWSTVIGVAQYDFYRPFDKGTSQLSGWLTHSYVEYPVVSGLNNELAPGDLVRSDIIGRPVKCSEAEAAAHPQCVVGKVIQIEKFATNFDQGMLQYMQLPADPGVLRQVLEISQAGPFQNLFGVRANLDVPNTLGAFRVVLTI